MVMTDPIADMLTRIRNANTMRNATVVMPANTLKVRIAKILKDEGFIVDFSLSGDTKKQLSIALKYAEGNSRVINGL
jgi:small subunit ribosomal protein S8